MDGVIKLLPDLVANQIAAGEVIQRPASAVKELMENAVDASADTIELWINDAGKKLIMVVDNGTGMSPADSRLCFERHATSKITRTDDLFSIRTLGFRGEALASIAAVAQLELKTRRQEDELATIVRIEGGKLLHQEPGTHPVGTTIAVKNLFFNVPARRNFLKGNNIEFKHIVEEFSRVVLSHEQITFKMFNDGRELFHLPASNLKQRIVNLFGGHYNSRFVPVEQDSEIVGIRGLIGKPEFSKKTRGEQYFFVNGRYFRHPYLHHAVLKAYTELIAESQFPSYFIFLTLDPAQVDVNIHPTKTEVNFIENQSIYAILHTAIRNALGKHNLTPSIDFETEPAFSDYFPANRPVVNPTISFNPDYNPFENDSPAHAPQQSSHAPASFARQTSMLNQRGWEKLYEDDRKTDAGHTHGSLTPGEAGTPDPQTTDSGGEEQEDTSMYAGNEDTRLIQLHNTYIIASLKSGLLVVNQQEAHQRILYEKFIKDMAKAEPVAQHLLFPIQLSLTPQEHLTLDALTSELNALGFDYHPEPDGTVSVTAIPADMPQESVPDVIESLMHQWNEEIRDHQGATKMARHLAARLCVKAGTPLSPPEMQALIDQLFNTEMPESSPSGKKTYTILPLTDINQYFTFNQP